MADDPLLDRARRVWLELAGVPIAFPTDVGGAAIGTAPTHDLVDIMREAGDGPPVAALTDPDRLRRAVPVAEVLGPATLAYCDDHAFQPIEPDHGRSSRSRGPVGVGPDR